MLTTTNSFAAKYGVRNIPTVLVFKGGEIVNRQVGVAPKNVYAEAIDACFISHFAQHSKKRAIFNRFFFDPFWTRCKKDYICPRF
jgi:thioredoxin-like negative regulator of GroEL